MFCGVQFKFGKCWSVLEGSRSTGGAGFWSRGLSRDVIISVGADRHVDQRDVWGPRDVVCLLSHNIQLIVIDGISLTVFSGKTRGLAQLAPGR